MSKKYFLRDQFTLVQGKEVKVGPCEVELSDAEFEANKHKLEGVGPETEAAPIDQESESVESEIELEDEPKKKKKK